jgi:hypothetical protein
VILIAQWTAGALSEQSKKSPQPEARREIPAHCRVGLQPTFFNTSAGFQPERLLQYLCRSSTRAAHREITALCPLPSRLAADFLQYRRRVSTRAASSIPLPVFNPSAPHDDVFGVFGFVPVPVVVSSSANGSAICVAWIACPDIASGMVFLPIVVLPAGLDFAAGVDFAAGLAFAAGVVAALAAGLPFAAGAGFLAVLALGVVFGSEARAAVVFPAAVVGFAAVGVLGAVLAVAAALLVVVGFAAVVALAAGLVVAVVDLGVATGFDARDWVAGVAAGAD